MGEKKIKSLQNLVIFQEMNENIVTNIPDFEKCQKYDG